MPEISATDIATAATQPQSASVDGQQAAAHPIPDQIEAAKFEAVDTALTGTNSTGGGPVSGWAKMRTARAKNCGGPQ